MLRNTSKLSLRKTSKNMSEENVMDFDISLNQEGNYERDCDLDFSLNLDKDDDNEENRQINAIGDQCIFDIRNLMKQRHELAVTKESLKYGMSTSRYPNWMRASLSCYPSLACEDDQTKFEEVWKNYAASAISDATTKTLNYLGMQIKEKEDLMQKCRKDSFISLGVATKGAGDKKKEIDNEIKKMNSTFAKKVEDHKDRIRSGNSGSANHAKDLDYHGRHTSSNYNRYQRGSGARNFRRRQHPY